MTNCPQGRQLAAISKQTTNAGKKEVQIESGVNNHIIPEHVLTDMKSPKGLGIEISF